MDPFTTFGPKVDVNQGSEAFPTREQIRLFSDLPLDIVRLIFEKTMEFKPLPLHLLCVSHQIRHWLEPLLYKHVALYRQSQVKKFYQTFLRRRHSSTKSEALFRRVHTFFVCERNTRPEKVVSIVKGLTGLRSLACWDTTYGKHVLNAVLDSSTTTINGAEIFPYKHLRRISFCATVLEERRITFAHRAFRDITHMSVFFQPFANWESLKDLQSLTHLSLDMVTGYPALDAEELPFWFNRILNACPTTVKVVILAVVGAESADFDLLDSEGHYLPLAWPPCDPNLSALETEGWTPWLTFELKRHNNFDPDELHPISRLALGLYDYRAVPAVVTDKISPNHLFRNFLVNSVRPTRRNDWDGTVDNYRDCWTVAEDVIEKRRGLTYARLISQLSPF